MPAKKNFYTYSEAQAAIQALGIKIRPDYKKRFREGPRLPASPDTVYAEAGWIGWYDFLRNERPSLYPTYAEAWAAVQALGYMQPTAKQMREELHDLGCRMRLRHAEAGNLMIKDGN
ncbi:integrase repeat-containing protein [Pseudomonas sp. ML96]|uniref:integrase repeat-containing protein n=1 Tax=Pseudomonas sp. ML96 TaxID=1523503 RepID=UPI0005B7767C|nr:integrase repeat-containing protein [Pseudomonas sp. ML96]